MTPLVSLLIEGLTILLVVEPISTIRVFVKFLKAHPTVAKQHWQPTSPLIQSFLT